MSNQQKRGASFPKRNSHTSGARVNLPSRTPEPSKPYPKKFVPGNEPRPNASVVSPSQRVRLPQTTLYAFVQCLFCWWSVTLRFSFFLLPVRAAFGVCVLISDFLSMLAVFLSLRSPGGPQG